VNEVRPDAFRTIILVLLLGLAAAAWVALVWPAHNMTMHMIMASPTMGMRAVPFLVFWVVMMVAMMLPTAAPMILAFHSAQAGKRHPDVAFDSTWAFVATYLLVWAFSGTTAYAGVLASAAVQRALSPATAPEVGGAILILAGIYQLTPVKQRCLSECRTPITMTSWHDDTASAYRMGLLHGVYCVGCCWLFFVILFPLRMSIGAMAAVTLVILGEKTLPRPEFVSYGAATVLVLYGLLVAVAPEVPAALRVFGSLTEDEGLGLGLLVWIAALDRSTSRSALPVQGSSFRVVESGHNRSFALQHERERVLYVGWPTDNAAPSFGVQLTPAAHSEGARARPKSIVKATAVSCKRQSQRSSDGPIGSPS
jgi:predicted metal-binding membrane protein